MNVFLLEDDLSLQESLKTALELKNYHVISVATCEEAYHCDFSQFDLAVPDIQLPDGNGVDVCRYIRESHEMPIIFLTANDLEESIIYALNSGGDDYVTKPFSLKVLYARIEALLRRHTSHHYGDLKIDVNNYKVYKNDEEIKLTAIEYEILFAFIRNKGHVLTRYQLLSYIDEKMGNTVEDNTLSVYMKRLRDKLGKYQDHYYIETIRGVGYRFYENK